MKLNFIRIVTAVFIIVFFYSCSVFQDDVLQVYDESDNPVNVTYELVGLPSVSLDNGILELIIFLEVLL